MECYTNVKSIGKILVPSVYKPSVTNWNHFILHDDCKNTINADTTSENGLLRFELMNRANQKVHNSIKNGKMIITKC